MTVDKLNDELIKILNTMPDDLQRGDEKRVDCPRCNGKNKALWSCDAYNGHKWCVCDDCGVLIRS